MAQNKQVLILYHEDIALRFPAHYRMPFLDILPRHGYEVRFICNDSRAQGLELRGDMVVYPRASRGGLWRLPLEYIGNKRRLERAIRAVLDQGFAPSFVFSFGYPWLLRAAESLRTRFGARHFTILGHLFCESKWNKPSLADKLQGLACRRVRDKVYAKADRILTTSEEMRKYFARFIDPAKVVSWPAGVDADIDLEALRGLRGTTRQELGINQDEVLGVYIGTIDQQRELDLVLRALALARRRSPRLHLLFMGYSRNPRDRNHLQAQAEASGLARHVTIHPAVPEDDLPRYMAAADFGLSPFKPTFVLRHNSPLKMSEYFRTGLPVAGTDIPDQRMALEQSGGGLVAAWDEQAYADVLACLAGMSPQEREAMGDKGRQWVRAHRDVRVLTDQMLQWMRE